MKPLGRARKRSGEEGIQVQVVAAAPVFHNQGAHAERSCRTFKARSRCLPAVGTVVGEPVRDDLVKDPIKELLRPADVERGNAMAGVMRRRHKQPKAGATRRHDDGPAKATTLSVSWPIERAEHHSLPGTHARHQATGCCTSRMSGGLRTNMNANEHRQTGCHLSQERRPPTSAEALQERLASLGDEVLCHPQAGSKAAIVLTLERCPSIKTLQWLASRTDRLRLIEQAGTGVVGFIGASPSQHAAAECEQPRPAMTHDAL
jgi:hypothetical protein